MPKPTILLLAGTGEGATLNHLLFEAGYPLVTSLAGVTRNPAPLKGEVLADGFGAVGGMENFLKSRAIDIIIDATHPFAAQMSVKAAALADRHALQYLRFARPAWNEVPGDHWILAENMEDAAKCAASFDRIFLSIGRKEVGAFAALTDRYFLLRSVEDVEFTPEKAIVEHLRAKGPFTLTSEKDLLAEKQIEVIVSKNSGGAATYAKIEAARQLNIPVIMITRPAPQKGQSFESAEGLLAALNLTA